MRLKLLVESPLWKTSCLNHQYCYDIGGNVNSLTQVLYCCLFQQLSFFKLNIGAPREALYCKVSAYIMHYLIIWKWKSFVVEFSLIFVNDCSFKCIWRIWDFTLVKWPNHLHYWSVTRFATEKIQPLVSEMDQKSEMDESIIDGMFEQGVRSISELSYFWCIMSLSTIILSSTKNVLFVHPLLLNTSYSKE